MNIKYLIFILLLLFNLTSEKSLAQKQGVHGTVTDEQGNPLPMVSIYIASERTGTTTNPEGKYEIPLDSGQYLLLKYLPVLSNRLWQESLLLSVLHTPQTREYFQVGYSIDQIFFLGSIGVFAGFEEGKYEHWGVRASLAF